MKATGRAEEKQDANEGKKEHEEEEKCAENEHCVEEDGKDNAKSDAHEEKNEYNIYDILYLFKKIWFYTINVFIKR